MSGERAAEIINNAAQKKTQEKKTNKAPHGRVNSNLNYVDHMWAKNGEVYYKTTYGETKHMSPKEAAELAYKINHTITRLDKRPDVKGLDKKKRMRDEMVDKLIKTARKAADQRKNPADKAEELLSYAYHGKDRHGNPFTAANTFGDKVLEDKKKEFPYLDEDDILAFLRSPNLSPQEADRMLMAENNKRQVEHMSQYSDQTQVI